MTTPDLLESLPEPHVLLEPVRDDSGAIVDFVYAAANPAACEFNRLPREQLVGARLIALHPNVADSGLLDSYRHLVETGAPIELLDWGYAQDLLGGEWRYYDVRAVRSQGCVSQIWLDVTERHAALEALAASEDEARRRQADTQAIFDSQLDPFVRFTTVYDESGRAVDLRFVEANPAAVAYNLTTLEQMIGRTFLEFYPGLMENGPMADYLACAVDGTPVVLNDYAYPNEILGSERRYDIRAVQCIDGIALTWRDITERYRATEELAASEQRYRLLADNSSDVIWQVGADGRVTWVSESTEAVLGWSSADVLGTVAADYIHLDDLHQALEARERVLGGSEIRQRYRVRRADGSHVWMGFLVRPIETLGGTGRIVALRDIDAEVTARDQLESILGRDPLTGLMTRAAMESAITAAVEEDDASHLSMICIGLDSLSLVNDAFGHGAGDVVLATTAARIVTQVADPDVVGRGAGVDFLVLLTDEEGVHDAAALAERIRAAVKEPIHVGQRRIEPTASIGIASDMAARDAGQLIRAATLAMRAAKDAGRDRVAYASSEMAAEAEQRVTVAAAVADALRAGEVTGWFQPITNLVSGSTAGYEALARWVGADGTVREPGAFLPAVERIPLIVDVDDAVMAAHSRCWPCCRPCSSSPSTCRRARS